jgi:hypothetical protein
MIKNIRLKWMFKTFVNITNLIKELNFFKWIRKIIIKTTELQQNEKNLIEILN